MTPSQQEKQAPQEVSTSVQHRQKHAATGGNADTTAATKAPAKEGDKLADGKVILYKIESLISDEGHTSFLYKATVEHVKPLARAAGLEIGMTVALKVLRDEAEGHQVTGFFEEAQLLRRLIHPNICKVYDFSKEDEQTAKDPASGLRYILQDDPETPVKIRGYYAMEYLEDVNLGKYACELSDKKVAAETVIDIGIQLAQALDYIHNQGIVHLDLKPANLVWRQRSLTLKVLDFGYASDADDSLEAAAVREAKKKLGLDPGAQVGTLFATRGTLGYAAPEQQKGEDIPDSRADIFSFGVTLYELLVGQHPFRVLHGGSVRYFETMQRVEMWPPIPESYLFEEVTEGRDSLRELILRMLKKVPDLRPQLASDVLTSLLAMKESDWAKNNGENSSPGKSPFAKTDNLRTQPSRRKNSVNCKRQVDGNCYVLQVMRALRSQIKKYRITKNKTHCELRFRSTALDPILVGKDLLLAVCEQLENQSVFVRIWARHRVFEEDGDKEFNYWRSKRAIDYLDAQRTLLKLGGGRVSIKRYFVASEEPSLRALSVIANHSYWGIEAYHTSVTDEPKFAKEGQKLLVVDFGFRRKSLPAKAGVEDSLNGGFVIALWEKADRATECGICCSAREIRSTATTLLQQMLAYESWSKDLTPNNQPKVQLMDSDALNASLGKLRDQPRRRDSQASSYLAFRVARSRLERSRFILAVDKTSVKRSLSVLQQDPGYREWQAAQFKALGDSDFEDLRRIFVIREGDQPDALNWLCKEYYAAAAAAGMSRKLRLRCTTIKDTEIKVRQQLKTIKNKRERLKPVTSELEARDPNFLEEHGLRGQGGVMDEKNERYWPLVVIRDFVVTDNMVYDYINPDAEVDLARTGDYWLLTNDHVGFQAIKGIYKWIFECIWWCGQMQWHETKGWDKVSEKQRGPFPEMNF